MGASRRWTFEEDEYLKEAWGKTSLQSICKHLDRSEQSVINRKHRLGLGAARDNNFEYVTLMRLIMALYGSNGTTSHTYEAYEILPKLLKIHMIPQPKVKRKCVRLSEFWEMAEKNRHLFDFSKLERYALGPEPDWVEEQRRIDGKNNTLCRGSYVPWTPHEDSLLISIASKKKYTCNELAAMFKRSEGSVVRRLTDLGLKHCLIRNPLKDYTQEEFDLIAKLIIEGYDYTLIAKQLGRSSKSIRGAVYQRLGTESLVKVRAKFLDGERLEARPRNYVRKEGKNE